MFWIELVFAGRLPLSLQYLLRFCLMGETLTGAWYLKLEASVPVDCFSSIMPPCPL